MNGSGGVTSGTASSSAQAGAEASWPRIVLWTLLFQIAWYWRKLPALFGEGALPDNDDFLRLMEVRNWMGGQGWYDLTQYRMDPPLGADMQWSRLVDLPIAALISFFDLFTDTVTAERLTALVWPTVLLVLTVLVIVAICRALVDRFNPLLAVLFTVMCFTALTEFMPGRLDHHGVQILLFCLALLGLVRSASLWGNLLVGVAIAASIAIGLETILLIVVMLAWLGLDWALDRDPRGLGLLRTAAGLAGASLLLYPLGIAPSQWLVARCDANSIVYLSALLAIAAAFVLMAMGSARLRGSTPLATFAMRAGTGAVLAMVVAGALYTAFPECAAGPYAAIGEELRTRWLVNVQEAQGLFQMLERTPALWFSVFAYALLLLVVGVVVVRRYGRERPAVVAVFAVLALSVGAMFLQYRALRIGIFASIPLCVLFAGMSWQWLEQRFAGKRLVAGALQALVIVAMLSPVWAAIGEAAFPERPGPSAAGTEPDVRQVDLPAWKTRPAYLFCNEESQYAVLASLPKGLVMNDINSGSPILVFTDHFVVGGPYHRNGRAILDMTDFFETDADKPQRIAGERGIDYVAWCDPGGLDGPAYADSPALAARLAHGEVPDWLEGVSPRDDRLQVFRVRPRR